MSVPPARHYPSLSIRANLKLERYQLVSMGHGGRRVGAGRKPKFSSPADRVVRVPSSVADQVLAIAAILDAYADRLC
ncbi:hypothetical protein OOK60_05540 [Trichothermofontia sichuanensis B231]|uniref:hypothetical protein n=1 Tax=Trichothermofontia sichuanensis TaxID=3045816 RepID=UPI0022463965|nr:hypothetical protein [Trichothermofontia sichuanensis]UZQ55537.1 hypothetical protein OOK60_05540 [Trichothermofontia sichuanensis B231]